MPECHKCIEGLVCRTAELATEDLELRAKALREGLKIAEDGISQKKIPTQIAGEAQRAIRKITKNKDPYFSMKAKEMKLAPALLNEVSNYYSSDNLRSCLTISALGNTLDFFRDLEVVRKEMKLPVEFAIDEIEKFTAKLKDAKKVLLLTDNAGECFFDFPLIKKLEESTEIIYVVKKSPVQNDLTLEDLNRSGLGDKIEKVMTTGTDTPGLDFSLASDEFKMEFEAADLVIAKGMGYYETLSELLPSGKIFHLLMAKCCPIADLLGVPLNSFVAMLR